MNVWILWIYHSYAARRVQVRKLDYSGLSLFIIEKCFHDSRKHPTEFKAINWLPTKNRMDQCVCVYVMKFF